MRVSLGTRRFLILRFPMFTLVLYHTYVYRVPGVINLCPRVAYERLRRLREERAKAHRERIRKEHEAMVSQEFNRKRLSGAETAKQAGE